MPIRIFPQQMALDFCQEIENVKHLVYIEQIYSFARYLDGKGYYKLLDNEKFTREVHRFLISRYAQAITMNTVKDVVGQVGCIIENRVDNIIESDYIALNDKLLNLKDNNFEVFHPEKKTFYHINASSQDLNIENCPRWISFLNEVLVDKAGNPDQSLINVIQEMFGYCLANTLEGHSSFFLVGDGNNGKSVMLSVLRAMIGEDFSESMSIETLTTNNFSASALIGKKINICVEEESSFVKSDKFKAFVSGDHISIEYKYGARFQWKPTAKFVFATNELPTFSGFNEGLLRRIKIIPFNKRIDDKKRDTKLTGKLINEMGGIVKWALLGLERLRNNKYICTVSEQCKEKLLEFSGNLSSGVLFFRENYMEDDTSIAWASDMYEEYKAWAERVGKKRQSYYSFLKDVSKVVRFPRGRDVKEAGRIEDFFKAKHLFQEIKPEF